MRSRMSRVMSVVCLSALALTIGAGVQAGEAEKTTHILTLQGVDAREAITVLRSQLQVRNIAELPDRGIVVLRDEPARLR